jgi:hypothetical protein
MYDQFRRMEKRDWMKENPSDPEVIILRGKQTKYSKKYRDSNPEKVKETLRLSKLKHKARIRTYENHRRATDPEFALAYHNRILVNKALKKAATGKKVSTKALLGGSVKEAVEYIEKQFKPGMTWENHGKWHIDHIIPLSLFQLQNSEEQEVAFHHINLQPLWEEENLRKSNNFTMQLAA